MNEKLYPFSLPAELEAKLPKPARGGSAYIDVKVNGAWEGILVIDDRRLCVGIRCDRQTVEYPLDFSPTDIKDIRPASLWNRTLAFLPSWLVLAYPYACFIILPLLILLDVKYAPAGSTLAIIFGLAAQRIVIEHLRAFCLFNILIVIGIFGFQTAALQSIVSYFLK